MYPPLVIIPTYNEAENIAEVLQTIFALSKKFHVLIVDDNSPDKTQNIVQKNIESYKNCLFLIVREKKLGLGTAYVAGFKFALQHGYNHIIQMDADFSHNPTDLIRLYDTCIKENHDLIIGSRYIQGVNVINWPIGRILLSYFGSLFVRCITGLPIMDTTAGFTCYTKAVLTTIDLDNLTCTGYGFQIAMKFLTWKYGFKIKEIPIVFTDRKKGSSKMSTKIIQEAFWDIIQLKIKSFFRKYRRS